MDKMDIFNGNNIALLNKETILEIFDLLDKKLKENSLHLDINLYGGTVMNLLYDNRPATRDIDCLFSTTDYKLLDNILKDIGFIFNLDKNWFNDDIKEPLKYLIKQDMSKAFNYENLTINIPSSEQLLAMKILSARPEPAKDFIDAALLCSDLEVKTKNELLNIVLKFLPKSILGERQIQFIKYLGQDLGYNWEE